MFVWYTNETGVPHVPLSSRVEPVARAKPTKPVADGSSLPDGTMGADTPPRKRNPYEAAQKHASSRRQPAVLAGQIASSPVVTLAPETSLTDARRLFDERGFRHVPILSEAGGLVGILSDRDLLREAAKAGGDSARTVGDIMRHRVLTATPETEIRALAATLLEERVGAMPIVDSGGQLVGILTRSDILRALVHDAPLDLWT